MLKFFLGFAAGAFAGMAIMALAAVASAEDKIMGIDDSKSQPVCDESDVQLEE